jgi:hypothetical protein
MSEQPPPTPPAPLPRIKGRLPFEPVRAPFAGGLKSGAVFLYAALALGLVCVALYMNLVLRHPLISAHVMAPAVGAAWFGLRLFMTLTPKE